MCCCFCVFTKPALWVSPLQRIINISHALFCLPVISLCLSWLLRLLCCTALHDWQNGFVFFFTFPPQNSIARLKVSHSPVWWCWWLMRSWVFILFSISYFSCRAAFHFRRLSLIIIISDRLSGVLNLSESCQARFVTLPCWKMMSKLEISGH